MEGIFKEVVIILTKEIKIPLLCYDFFFKSVFKDNENILAKMISNITGLDYKLLKDNIILETNELPVSRKNEKFKKCDFIIRVGKDMILNLELNKNSYSELLIKNLSYVFNLFSTVTKKGNNYNKNLKIIQININCFKDNFYDKNIPLTDFNKIPIITKGILDEKECNLLMDKINKLTKEDYFMTEEESLEWGDWIENSIYNRALEEKQDEMIKSMFENGLNLEMISKVANMEIEKIEKIINE